MKDKKRQNRRGKPRSDASEIGVIRVLYNPGPDAEDRLRRLMSLMVRHATRDGQAPNGEDAPPDDRNADDPTEAEA